MRSSLEAGRRPELARELLRLFDERPIIGGLEVSVVLRRSVEVFEHPAPYELHFSEAWADDVRAGGSGPSGTDPDLAAHCTVVRSRGIALAGPPPETVFGEVPRAAYLEAILDDLRWIVQGGIVTSPYDGALNICRCAQVLLGDAVVPPSKDEAAAWALAHLPDRHGGTIAEALACYRAAAAVPPRPTSAARPPMGRTRTARPRCVGPAPPPRARLTAGWMRGAPVSRPPLRWAGWRERRSGAGQTSVPSGRQVCHRPRSSRVTV